MMVIYSNSFCISALKNTRKYYNHMFKIFYIFVRLRGNLEVFYNLRILYCFSEFWSILADLNQYWWILEEFGAIYQLRNMSMNDKVFWRVLVDVQGQRHSHFRYSYAKRIHSVILQQGCTVQPFLVKEPHYLPNIKLRAA